MSYIEPVAPEPVSLPNGDIDFRGFIRVVLKHRRLVAAIFLFALGYGVFDAMTAPRVWEATATVKLPSSGEGGEDGEALNALMSLGSSTDPVATFMGVAKSNNVASRVARMVDLTRSKEFSGARDVTAAAEALLGAFSVTNVEESNLLDFHIRVGDPDLAVRLADAWAQGFIDANLDFQRSGASSRRTFIEAQMVAIKANLNSGEEELKRLAQRQGVMHGGSWGGSGDPALGIESRVEDLMMERSQLASIYKPDYPHLKAVDTEYKAVLAQLDKVPEDELAYTRLERDVKAYETIYNLLLEKDQEERISENTDDSGIVVVDWALPPGGPVAPDRRRIVVLALLVGLFASFGVAFGLERWMGEIGGEAELERLSGRPTLAMIPDWRIELAASDGSKQKAQAKLSQKGTVRHDPASLITSPVLKHSYYNEAFRSFRTNLSFSGVDRAVKSFSVLSSNPSEGKTLVNANLALALAATGKKVLLVDADMRKPAVHKIFGVDVEKERGLPVLLSGKGQDLEAHLVEGPVPGLWLMPCGVIPPNPSELLESAVFGAAVEAMKQRFDHVLFDAAPILPVTDGVLLAARLDGVALLARYESTRHVEFKRALESLLAVRASVLGTVLNAVDISKYSYSSGYGRRYYSYHTKS